MSGRSPAARTFHIVHTALGAREMPIQAISSKSSKQQETFEGNRMGYKEMHRIGVHKLEHGRTGCVADVAFVEKIS
jgi:hypothetical protein